MPTSVGNSSLTHQTQLKEEGDNEMEKNIQDFTTEAPEISSMKELDDSQLALVGGGIGETAL